MHPGVRLFITVLIAMSALTLSAAERAPNVVMIVTDDLNSYGFYQTHPDALMPNIEAFKDTAVTFDLAYCAAPACAPSRASFLHGLYPQSTGVLDNQSDIRNTRPGTVSMPA